MLIHGIYFIIAAILIFDAKPAVAKILFKRSSISRNDEDWDPAAESFGRITSVKRQPFDSNHKVNKVVEFEDLRDDALESYGDKRNKKRSPFGVVYSGGQPIGVIEPLYQSYQFRNLDDTIHNDKKRDLDDQLQNNAISEMDHHINNANLHGGKYAAVLANFKIDNRLKTDAYKNDDAVSIEKRREKSRITKRDPFEERKPAKDLSKPSNFIGPSMTKTKREIVDLEKIEQNILNVMNDLGLVKAVSKIVQKRYVNATQENDREKRDYDEDEDLEMGSNKISITKENLDRSKKDNFYPNIEDVPKVNHRQNIAASRRKRRLAPKILNYQYEGENYIRNRRHNSDAGTIVKDLETSGELTVSGNKSPLVSVNSEQNFSDNKRAIKATTSVNTTGIKKRNDDYNDYERELEKNIQDKITAIKTDVKREIHDLKEKERKIRNIDIIGKERFTDSVNEGYVTNETKREIFTRNKRNNMTSDDNIKDIASDETINKRTITLENLGNEKESKDEAIEQIRMSRQVDDDLTEDQYLDLTGDNEEANEISRKRETNINNAETDFIKDKRTIDVSINSDPLQFSEDIQQNGHYINEANTFVKRSNDLNLSNNATSILQANQPANVENAGNVPQSGSPTNTAPLLQAPSQVHQPINQIPQSSIQPSTSGSNINQQVPARVDIAPQVSQLVNASQAVISPNLAQLTGMVNQSNQGTASLVPNQLPHAQEANSPSVYLPIQNGDNRSLRSQNLEGEYDDVDFEKDKEVRSAHSELDDDAAVRLEKDTSDNDNFDEEEDSDNERNLVRQERFLQNITEDELRNLENENPSLEQRKRRQAINQYKDYRDDKLPFEYHERDKRSYYDTFHPDEEIYNDMDSFDEPEKQGVYRKRNINYDHDYEEDNDNTCYNNIKRQRRNNYPTYLENSDSDIESYDILPAYYSSEDYRRRKRQAPKSAYSLPGNEPLMKFHRKEQSSDRNYRKKRLGTKINRKSAKDINMDALANSELFGGLPQSFQGELSRFKRVKRSDNS